MTQADSASLPGADLPPRRLGALRRGLIMVPLGGLLAFVVAQGLALCKEWGDLRHDLATVRRGAVIGYKNIHPNPSYASRPDNWFHHDGQSTLLWSGWTDRDGHGWFRVGRGEVARERISLPIGRDVVQAIDHPLVEVSGGPIWGRIPDEAAVVGQELAGVMSVYPVQVLAKVGAVNDEVGRRPFLIVFNPSAPSERAVHIYDPVVDGSRLTMGTSGYFLDGLPLFYDRGSESFWVEEPGTLRAVAGRLKGARLRQVGEPSPVPWGDWRWRHPGSRLLIGDDRPKPPTAG